MGFLKQLLFGANASEKKYHGLTHQEWEQVIIQSDIGNQRAKQIVSDLFNQGLTANEYNQLRLSVYKPLAENGDPAAAYWMGLLTNHDAALSRSWYERAAAGGDTNAMMALSFGYSEFMNDPSSPQSFPGFGADPNMELFWLSKAAKAGDAHAQHDLGQKYELGDIVEKNIEDAITWYTAAANQGYPKALLSLGQIYDCPTNTIHDPQKAFSWFQRAVNSGDRDIISEAARCLALYYGGCYIYGTPPLSHSDPNQALYWLCQAYILGDNPYNKESINKLCAATNLSINDTTWAQWVEEAKRRVCQ